MTFNRGANGEHQIDACGEACRITLRHFRELAAKGGVKRATASGSLESLLDETEAFESRLENGLLRRATVRIIMIAVKANATALQS